MKTIEAVRLEAELYVLGKELEKMAKKLEGIALANDIMLKELAAFMAAKKFYGKEVSAEEQQKKAAFDISKRGKLYKMLAAEGIVTKYDLALNIAPANLNTATFGDYAKIVQQYRAQVIKKSFQHRKDECK